MPGFSGSPRPLPLARPVNKGSCSGFLAILLTKSLDLRACIMHVALGNGEITARHCAPWYFLLAYKGMWMNLIHFHAFPLASCARILQAPAPKVQSPDPTFILPHYLLPHPINGREGQGCHCDGGRGEGGEQEGAVAPFHRHRRQHRRASGERLPSVPDEVKCRSPLVGTSSSLCLPSSRTSGGRARRVHFPPHPRFGFSDPPLPPGPPVFLWAFSSTTWRPTPSSISPPTLSFARRSSASSPISGSGSSCSVSNHKPTAVRSQSAEEP